MSVIVVVADSLRHDVIGCAGGPARTPTLDALAGEGAWFERVITAAPWTVPSVASMLTGVYAHRLGLAKWEQPFPEEHATLFDLAGDAGLDVCSFVFDPSHLFRRVPTARVQGSSQDTEALLGWLRCNRGQRFFLFIHYFWTHIPYLSTPMTPAAWRTVTDKVLAALRTSEDAREGVKRLYTQAVERFSEDWLPRLLELVDLDDCWLVITSDHGESWGERPEVGRVRDVFDLHGNTLYDEVLRVPLILRPPGGGVSRVIGGLARTVDLMPTLAELAGLDPATPLDDIDGLSLARCVRSGEPAPAQEALSARNNDVLRARELPGAPEELWAALSLTTPRYKQVLELPSGRRAAFDLVDDPGETRDISGEALEALEPGWRRLSEEVGRARVGHLSPEDVALTEARLRSLGYLS